MKTILDQIIETKKDEIRALKESFTYRDFEVSPYFTMPCRSISEGLKNGGFGIIAEMKRKSPSAGVINEKLNVNVQAKAYKDGGAIAISCLTDSTYFGGSNEDIAAIRKAVDLPILRKEFILDELQLFESKAIGADAILLIASVLSKEEALHLTIMAQQLGMEVLMEFHDQSELFKLNEFVDIIGINNRNLHAQKTDINQSYELFNYLPYDRTIISESGISTNEEINKLAELGYHGALMGERILNDPMPSDFIASLTRKNSVPCL
jgi:indole-3-glycerol phosphate synthase